MLHDTVHTVLVSFGIMDIIYTVIIQNTVKSVYMYVYSRTPIIQTLDCPNAILNVEIPKTVQFSAKPSNKWNACVIFRLVRLIISQYSGWKRHIGDVILLAAYAFD